MKKHISSLLIILLATTTLAQASKNGIPNFKWMKDVGAKTFPKTTNTYYVNNYGAIGDAITDCTKSIQKAIDECAANGGGKVTFKPGIYLTGSIFVKSNVNFEIPKGTMIIGSQSINDYQKIDTRVAGIEMNWPAALINIIGQKNAAISGDGVVHGRGKPFWDNYYEMRKEYEPKGLRWIVDYDCQRPRGILVADCENVTLKDFVLYQAGFWSVHVLYSEHVTLDGINISNNIEGKGPSTDGIDIDSSRKILVQNCIINCNDDNICLKAGRDADGLRVNRPCEYVVIRDCETGYGHGLFTCGSETSGGIRNIVAYNLKANGTGYGLRFKSTTQRGGIIENIWISNVEMVNVQSPFVIDMNWHPAYSTSLLPEGYTEENLPIHWKKMLEPVDPKDGTPKFRNIYLQNIKSTGGGTSIKAGGIESSTLDNFHLKNVHFSGKEAGIIKWANNWIFSNFTIKSESGNPLKLENNINVKP